MISQRSIKRPVRASNVSYTHRYIPATYNIRIFIVALALLFTLKSRVIVTSRVPLYRFFNWLTCSESLILNIERLHEIRSWNIVGLIYCKYLWVCYNQPLRHGTYFGQIISIVGRRYSTKDTRHQFLGEYFTVGVDSFSQHFCNQFKIGSSFCQDKKLPNATYY